MRSVFGAPDELFEEAKHPQETFQLLLPVSQKRSEVSTFPCVRNRKYVCVYNFVNLVPRYQKIDSSSHRNSLKIEAN